MSSPSFVNAGTVGGGNLFSTQHTQAPYGPYRISTAYLWSNGTLKVPLASAGLQNSQMVQVNNPVGMKLVLWTAERLGQSQSQIPDMPAARANQGEVLSYKKIIPLAPALNPTGDTYIYRAYGIYAFFLSAPLNHDSGQLYVPSEPLDTTPPGPLSPGQFAAPAAQAGQTIFSQDHVQNFYDVSRYETEYVWDNGCIQQPVTNYGPSTIDGKTFGSTPQQTSCEIIQASSPSGWRKVSWSSERVGSPPTLPPPLPQTGEYLAYWTIAPSSPKLNATGDTYSFRVDGEYLFHCTVPYDETVVQLPMGVVGYDGSAQQSLQPYNFNPNLVSLLPAAPQSSMLSQYVGFSLGQ